MQEVAKTTSQESKVVVQEEVKVNGSASRNGEAGTSESEGETGQREGGTPASTVSSCEEVGTGQAQDFGEDSSGAVLLGEDPLSHSGAFLRDFVTVLGIFGVFWSILGSFWAHFIMYSKDETLR